MLNSRRRICKNQKGLFLLAWLLVGLSERAIAVDFWQPITEANLRAVVATEERIVAVGEPGFIMTSTNGVDWQQCVSTTPGVLNAVTFGDGKFLAVGRDGTAIKSSDGVTWQRTYLGVTNRLEGAYFLSNRFVLVGYGIQGNQFYGTVQVSSNASDWNVVHLAYGQPFLRAALQTDASLIVAGGAVILATEDNLSDWRQLPYFLSNVRKFLPSPLGMLALGNGGRCDDGICDYDAQIGLSTNVFEWQWARAEISTDYPFSSVAYGNGRFVAVGSGGQDSSGGTVSRNKGSTAFSLDGLNWSINQRPAGEDLYDVCFFKGRFVAVGHRGLILVSEDGIEWIKVNDPLPTLPTELLNVAYADGLFVAVGYGGAIITSTNGWWWEPRVSGISSYLQGVARGADRWVVTGANGVVLRSADGKSWEQQPFSGNHILTDVAFGGGMFVAVAVGSSGNTLFTSPDGSEWTPHTVMAADLSNVAFDADRFVVTGRRNIATSSDGQDWETYPVTNSIAEVAFENGLFIGLTGGFPLCSTDGSNWFQTEGLYRRATINTLSYGPGGYVAAGQNIIAVSRDGKRWNNSAKPPITSFNIHAAAFGGGHYVLAGGEPGLMISRHHLPKIAAVTASDLLTVRLQMETDSGLAYELQTTDELSGDWMNTPESSNSENYEVKEVSIEEQPMKFFRVVPKLR